MTEFNHTATECMFNTRAEEQFLYSVLKPDMDVLEMGAGRSSLAIAPLVKSLVSIEHLRDWYNEIKPQLPSNAKIYFVPKDKEEPPGHDGGWEHFGTYIDYPNKLGKKYDCVFLDGRARVQCAFEAMKWLKDENSFILIHDIFNDDNQCDRREYWHVLEFLHPVAGEMSLWKFKPKRNL